MKTAYFSALRVLHVPFYYYFFPVNLFYYTLNYQLKTKIDAEPLKNNLYDSSQPSAMSYRVSINVKAVRLKKIFFLGQNRNFSCRTNFEDFPIRRGLL